jgi:penicillin-binding protein 2
VSGKNLVLTVDMDLQAIMEEEAADALSGAVVALDPRDGTILGMFSKPGYNPNAWSGRLSEQEKRQSDNNPFHPMLDKTVLSWFPASTYKFITAVAGLEEGRIDDETAIECPGHFDYGNRRFHCWNRFGHGELNLREAMAVSCDVYFYQIGLELGIDTLASYAFEFGFGERPGLGLNGESAGLVPTRAWHEENSPGGFQYGFTVNTSVGQGDTRTSPLQLALAYAAIANGGTLYYPRVVDRITTWDGTVVFDYPARVRRSLRFSEDHMEELVDGLYAVVHDPIGTAHEQELDWIQTAGKTGTAQVRELGTERLQDGEVIHWDRDHAWFVAFAPLDNPQFVVAVFLEHGGQGSSAAAPVAMRVLDRYFREVLDWEDEIAMATLGGDSRELDALLEGGAGEAPSLDTLFARAAAMHAHDGAHTHGAHEQEGAP